MPGDNLVDHLLLLVGSNPLPNAVAGKLLTAHQGAITLIHSDDSFPTARRLQGWLSDQGFPQPTLKAVGESDPASIYQAVWDALQGTDVGTVGLNYTGGTKAMSVHAYRAVEQWARAGMCKPVFSYLDARKLAMVFDPADPASGEHARMEYVGQAVELKLASLLQLHGWTLKKDDLPVTISILPESAGTLTKVHADKEVARRWKDWTEHKLGPHARKGESQWRNDELRTNPLDWPSCAPDSSLAGFITTFTAETGSPGNQQLDFAAPKDHGHFAKTKHIPAWLHGKWLEHHVLDVLYSLAQSCSLHECVQNIVPNEVEFDVDVIAMRGYQLFAVSCSTDSGKALLKSKLFEAAIRARQLGGDEACVALVSCSDDPDKLQNETRHVFSERAIDRPTRGNERIKVFGRKHLADLGKHLEQWIKDQSQGT